MKFYVRVAETDLFVNETTMREGVRKWGYNSEEFKELDCEGLVDAIVNGKASPSLIVEMTKHLCALAGCTHLMGDEGLTYEETAEYAAQNLGIIPMDGEKVDITVFSNQRAYCLYKETKNIELQYHLGAYLIEKAALKIKRYGYSCQDTVKQAIEVLLRGSED